MSKSKTDHIVVDAKKGGAFVCKNCGEEYLPNMPINIDDWLVLSKNFTKRHKACKEKKNDTETGTQPASN